MSECEEGIKIAISIERNRVGSEEVKRYNKKEWKK